MTWSPRHCIPRIFTPTFLLTSSQTAEEDSPLQAVAQPNPTTLLLVPLSLSLQSHPPLPPAVVRTSAAWIFTDEPQPGEPRCTSLTGGLMADEKQTALASNPHHEHANRR
ncbi:uncharacterized protein BDZ83DRAFT_619941 [Colletotrichum acutatum]|uniref:Uncharacterized protein n=1 Tax=Glomerella acutata TaxID=27357 RepID=A0AAD8XF04_GLOAC|nr:uncharacterized protein BDZ83DRAFT_619941 [Colletotrichum acutatum]KAK1725354.1 hypothetical protein BDZ83DRAFT_619941 [Colletotrichum acutatum]